MSKFILIKYDELEIKKKILKGAYIVFPVYYLVLNFMSRVCPIKLVGRPN